MWRTHLGQTTSSKHPEAPQIVPIRQSDGTLEIVQIGDDAWSEMETFLESNQPQAVMTFLPPERHLEPLLLSITMKRGIPLVCGSVYNLPWSVQAYHYSNANCIVSEAAVLPYLLRVLKDQKHDHTLHILLIAEDNQNELSPEEYTPLEIKVTYLSNPLARYVSG